MNTPRKPVTLFRWGVFDRQWDLRSATKTQGEAMRKRRSMERQWPNVTYIIRPITVTVHELEERIEDADVEGGAAS